jgi:thymidylate synthase (FAD)
MSNNEVYQTKRSTVKSAEEILGQEIPVLDKGFVRLVDYMGGDDRVVQSARVSYGDGTKSVREDKGLINYLIEHRHTSPFEQVIMTFHQKLPIFVARQQIRHRTARLNEMSGRYSVMRDEFYVPSPEDIRFQSADNKQGRSENEVPPEIQQKVLDIITQDQKTAYTKYEEMINDDIAKELARINLPLSLYTEWYWQMDLHNMFHFLKLRMDGHAQKEIRDYANAMALCTKAVAPISYEAFEEHVLYGRHYSKTEVEVIDDLISTLPKEQIKEAASKIENQRRRSEFLKKLGA